MDKEDEKVIGEYLYKLFFMYKRLGESEKNSERYKEYASRVKQIEQKISKEHIKLVKDLHNEITQEEFLKDLDQIMSDYLKTKKGK